MRKSDLRAASELHDYKPILVSNWYKLGDGSSVFVVNHSSHQVTFRKVGEQQRTVTMNEFCEMNPYLQS